MAKSIRSKKKRKLRALKREKLDGDIATKIEERTLKLKALVQAANEKKAAAKAIEDAAKGAEVASMESGDEDAAMDFKEDDYNEFGKPPKTRRSKANQEQKRKKTTKKKGVKAFLNFASKNGEQKARGKKRSVGKKYFKGV